MIPAQTVFQSWTGDGTTVAFNFARRIYLAPELVVYTYRPGIDAGPVKQTTGFTVAVASDFTGATITFTTAPAVGVKVGAIRQTTLSQDINISNTDYVPPSSVEKQLDRQAMMAQEVARLAGSSLQLDPFGFSSTFDAGGSQIIGAADATVGSGLVTLSQLAVALATGVVGPAGSVTKRQVVLALVDATNPAGANMLPTVNAAADPTAADAGSAEWFAGSAMASGDALYLLIQSATGWNGTQMAVFMTLARSKPV